MRRSFAIISLVFASWTEAFAGLELDGGVVLSVINPTQVAPGGGRIMLPFNSLGLRYRWPGGVALGIRHIAPLKIDAFSLGRGRARIPASAFAAQAGPSGLPTLPSVNASYESRIPLPAASLLDFTFPLFSLGIFHTSASLGLGGANWGAVPWFSADLQVGGMPRLHGEIKIDEWTLAYSALMNLECKLGRRLKLYASGGYMSLGSIPLATTASPLNARELSVRGLAFSVGLGFGF